MARMIPKVLANATPASEVKVHRALGGLSDDWVVLHSVSFIMSTGNERAPFTGEADFVLLHQRYGYIVLEVKGGIYEVKEGTWYAGLKREEMDRSPFEQAKSNRFDLRRHIIAATGIKGIQSGHAVAFPDARPAGRLGLEAPGNIIVDGNDLANIQAAIERVSAYWFPSLGSSISATDFNKLIGILAPSSQVVADRRFQIDATSAEIVELTQKQILSLIHI